MPKDIDVVKEIDEFKEALFLHDDAYRFIRHHKIWQGFLNYGWASKILVLFGILISFSMIDILIEWKEDIFEKGSGVIASTSSMFEHIKEISFDGSIKYLVLALTAILIFHCSVKTINILDGKNRVPMFKDFVDAQKRMIAILFRSFVFESIASLGVSIVLGVFGLGVFKFIPMFFIHSFFIGFAFFDSYNEQYGFNIKESAEQAKQRIGSVVAIGMVAVLLLKIPFVGAIVAPILCTTAATMYLYNEGVHWPQLPRIFHEDELKLKVVIEEKKYKA